MKTIIKFMFTLLILFAFSCSQETTLDPLPTDLDGVSAKANSKTPVDVTLDDGGAVVGSATLHRSENGITVNIKTSELLAGGAYTVWFIIFEPGGVFIDALYAAGHVIGGNGMGNFSAHLSEGDVSGSIASGLGLTDAEHQGVHMVIRSHGLAIPGMVDDQIHTVGGGCGTNTCVDEQSAIFFPIAP
jgi:hypothetical protein